MESRGEIAFYTKYRKAILDNAMLSTYMLSNAYEVEGEDGEGPALGGAAPAEGLHHRHLSSRTSYPILFQQNCKFWLY